MTTEEAVRALRERWLVLIAATLVAALAGYVYLKMPWVQPRWRSSVLLQATGRLDYGNFLALEKELRPLAEQVLQLGVMREVDRSLHTDLGAETMLEHTRAEPVQDSDQIRIDVEDADPVRAAQLSLAIADAYTQQHNAQEQGKLREERVILRPLDRPTQATLIWPQTRILVPAAGLLGLLVAGLVVLAMVYLDDSIRTTADVQRYLELPVLGLVPRHSAPSPRTTRSDEPQPSTATEVEVPKSAARV